MACAQPVGFWVTHPWCRTSRKNLFDRGIFIRCRAASGITEFDALLDKARAKAPARSLVSIEDVGVATAFLAHDAARLITGETLYIDGGYHIMD
jgi:enoyl-[acyl-carrier-protein] reductase (NADH)